MIIMVFYTWIEETIAGRNFVFGWPPVPFV